MQRVSFTSILFLNFYCRFKSNEAPKSTRDHRCQMKTKDEILKWLYRKGFYFTPSMLGQHRLNETSSQIVHLFVQDCVMITRLREGWKYISLLSRGIAVWINVIWSGTSLNGKQPVLPMQIFVTRVEAAELQFQPKTS